MIFYKKIYIIMGKVQIVLSGTFFAGAAAYFAALCVMLWLAATVAELVKTHQERRREFYKVIFWIIYMFSALVCGIFALSENADSSFKVEILMILLVADIIMADKLSRLFEIMVAQTVRFIRAFRRKFM